MSFFRAFLQVLTAKFVIHRERRTSDEHFSRIKEDF